MGAVAGPRAFDHRRKSEAAGGVHEGARVQFLALPGARTDACMSLATPAEAERGLAILKWAAKRL